MTKCRLTCNKVDTCANGDICYLCALLGEYVGIGVAPQGMAPSASYLTMGRVINTNPFPLTIHENWTWRQVCKEKSIAIFRKSQFGQ